MTKAELAHKEIEDFLDSLPLDGDGNHLDSDGLPFNGERWLDNEDEFEALERRAEIRPATDWWLD